MTGMYKELLPKYDLVHDFVATYQPWSLVDWGCANGNLLNRVKTDFPGIQELAGYDPGNADYNVVPTGTYDCLVSCDVIEHFEPDQLDQSLKLMQSKFSQAAFVIIACYPAKKFLADGRNAHLIVENADWWLERVTQQFDQCNIVWSEKVNFSANRKKNPAGSPELRLILEHQNIRR
jgi:hypothetical protein